MQDYVLSLAFLVRSSVFITLITNRAVWGQLKIVKKKTKEIVKKTFILCLTKKHKMCWGSVEIKQFVGEMKQTVGEMKQFVGEMKQI